MALLGVYLVASGLLVVAGAAKAARPRDTARALAALLPGRHAPGPGALGHLVRAGAGVEAALGLAALAIPTALPAALVAGSYVAFAAVVALALARGGPLSSCGCFGRPDTPPTVTHLALDLVLAAAAGAVAFGAPAHGTLIDLLGRQPWSGAPLLFVSAVATWLTALALSALGALEGSRRLVHAHRRRGDAP